MSEKLVEVQTGGVSVKESETKWLSLIIVCFTLLMGTVAFFLYNEQTQINHRLDVRDAYFNKGLIDLTKQSQEAYRKERKRNLEILEYCRNNSLVLPVNLAVPEPEINFKSVESVLMEEPQTGGK